VLCKNIVSVALFNYEAYVQKALERINVPIFIVLCKNIVSVALFNYGKLHTLVSMVTLLTMGNMVKQLVQIWDPLLHKYDFNSHIKILWLPWLLMLKSSWPHIVWYKFFIHPQKFEHCHFGTFEATG
jgi:hypothetical protein